MNLQNLASKSQTTNNSDSQSEEMMTNYIFRPFNPTDEEYQAIVDLYNTVWSDNKTTVERMRHGDNTRRDDRYFHRIVCEVDGRIVNFGIYCQTWWSKRQGQYFINLLTLPEYRNQGIGTAFYDHVYNIISKRDDFKLILADTREDNPQSIRFLEKRGFKQVMRYPRSHINVQAFESERYDGLISKLEKEGIRFYNVNQLAEKYEDYQRKIYDMETEIDKDIPSPDPFDPMPFDEYQQQLFGSPTFYPEAWCVAVDNDHFVGLSALWKTTEQNKLATGMTGVRRTHRRRGLATAMKAQALGFAKGLGVVDIDTDNEENNPMYQLNMQLGFEPLPAYLDFQNVIVPEAESEN